MARGRARQDGTVVPQGPDYGGALAAIKKNCTRCCGDMNRKLCPVNGCDLWPFRMGRGPDIARHMGWQVDPPKNAKDRVL